MKILGFLLLLLVSSSAYGLNYGIDRLDEAQIAKKFEGKNLAVLTHAAGKSKSGVHLIDSLHQKFQLKKIFAPEHGLRTMADDWVEDGIDEATGLPVISLYKSGSRTPRPEDLKGIDAIVIDLQDVGVRYYTYFSTIAEVMKGAATFNIEVIILDRPNLLGGIIMEGKVLDEDLAGSFTAYHTVPTRHGMTLGELALMINTEKNIGTKLTVIPVAEWKRESLLFTTERQWLAPSPALISIDQVGLYAIWGALENFNIAVGRGQSNELAFRVVGAPWISKKESVQLAKNLTALNIPGISINAFSWKVDRALYAGKEANGVRLEWNGEEVRSDEFTYKVSAVLVKMFGSRISINKMAAQSYGSKKMIEAFQNNISWETYQKTIDTELEKFKVRRKPFLLY